MPWLKERIANAGAFFVLIIAGILVMMLMSLVMLIQQFSPSNFKRVWRKIKKIRATLIK